MTTDGALVGVIQPEASPEADRNQTVTSPEADRNQPEASPEADPGGVWVWEQRNNRNDADLWGMPACAATGGRKRYVWTERKRGGQTDPRTLGIDPMTCSTSKLAAYKAFRAAGGNA